MLSILPAYEFERYDLEQGDKILLPPSALSTISRYKLPYPCIFSLTNIENPKLKAYVGVLEFVAPENYCYVPNWIFEHLNCFLKMQIKVDIVPEVTD